MQEESTNFPEIKLESSHNLDPNYKKILKDYLSRIPDNIVGSGLEFFHGYLQSLLLLPKGLNSLSAMTYFYLIQDCTLFGDTDLDPFYLSIRELIEEGKYAEVAEHFQASMWKNAISGAIGTGIGLTLSSKPVLALFEVDQKLIALIQSVVFPYCAGVVPLLLFIAERNFLQVTRYGAMTSIGSSVFYYGVKSILSYVLIPTLSLQGVGIIEATTAWGCLILSSLFLGFYPSFRELKLFNIKLTYLRNHLKDFSFTTVHKLLQLVFNKMSQFFTTIYIGNQQAIEKESDKLIKYLASMRILDLFLSPIEKLGIRFGITQSIIEKKYSIHNWALGKKIGNIAIPVSTVLLSVVPFICLIGTSELILSNFFDNKNPDFSNIYEIFIKISIYQGISSTIKTSNQLLEDSLKGLSKDKNLLSELLITLLEGSRLGLIIFMWLVLPHIDFLFFLSAQSFPELIKIIHSFYTWATITPPTENDTNEATVETTPLLKTEKKVNKKCGCFSFLGSFWHKSKEFEDVSSVIVEEVSTEEEQPKPSDDNDRKEEEHHNSRCILN